MGRRSSRRGRSRRVGLLLLLLLALTLAGAYVLAQRADPAPPSQPPSPAPAAGVLRIHYVDVGQGDGVVWELPEGTLAVYDCGPPAPTGTDDPLVRYLRDVLGRPAGSRIAALVSSHGHLDHIGGCDGLFATFVVERVYETWYEGADAPESYRRYQREVQAEGSVLHKLPDIGVGTDLRLPSVDATVLWPAAFGPGGWDSIAESSIVVRLRHGATSFCFQGDIEEAQERELATRYPESPCDAYLVGHHGSRYASTEAWLARMDPEIAVVSYGDNSYGHPHPEAICRVQQAGAEVHATAGVPGGAIILESDGAVLRVVRGQPVAMDACAAP